MKLKPLMAAALLSLSSLAMAQTCNLQDGRDYKKITVESPVSQKVQKDVVIEFFSYACPHCAHFAPLMHQLEGSSPDVARQIMYVPVAFRPDWVMAAKLYYALDSQKLATYENNKKVFDAVHVEKKKILVNEKEMAEFLNKNFPSQAAKIIEGINSFDVANKLAQAGKIAAQYQVDVTPLVIVDKSRGQYRVDAALSQGYPNMLSTIDKLARCKE